MYTRNWSLIVAASCTCERRQQHNDTVMPDRLQLHERFQEARRLTSVISHQAKVSWSSSQPFYSPVAWLDLTGAPASLCPAARLVQSICVVYLRDSRLPSACLKDVEQEYGGCRGARSDIGTPKPGGLPPNLGIKCLVSTHCEHRNGLLKPGSFVALALSMSTTSAGSAKNWVLAVVRTFHC